MRELYEIYLELGHEVFEEKIKKPMEVCLHNSGSNVISIIFLNTIIFRDFYFRALGSLVVLSFPQLLSFSSVFPKSLFETRRSSSDGRNPLS